MIVISVLFGWYKPEHLMHAIDKIREGSDAEIVVFGSYIELKREFAELLGQSLDIFDYPELIAGFSRYEDELEKRSRNNFIFVSKRSLFCKNEDLRSCKIWFDKKPFSYDKHHLSLEASKYAAKKLKESRLISL